MGEVPVLAPTPPGAANRAGYPPDLARVVATCEHLPDAIKTAIVTLVQVVRCAEQSFQSRLLGNRKCPGVWVASVTGHCKAPVARSES